MKCSLWRYNLKINKMLKSIVNKFYCKLNPVSYARSIGVKVGNNVRFYGAKHHMFSTEPWLITIGDNVSITSDVQFLTHDGGTLVTKNIDKSVKDFVICGNIVVGDNVYIGIRTIVLPGVTIGSNCIIGCGSIVTKDIPDNSVACGVPCKVISSTEKYISKIHDIIDGKNERYYADLEYMHSLNPIKNKSY